MPWLTRAHRPFCSYPRKYMAKACSKVLTNWSGCVEYVCMNETGVSSWGIPSKLQLHTCHIFGVDAEVFTANNNFSSRRTFCGGNASHHWRRSHRYIYIFAPYTRNCFTGFLLDSAVMFVRQDGWQLFPRSPAGRYFIYGTLNVP